MATLSCLQLQRCEHCRSSPPGERVFLIFVTDATATKVERCGAMGGLLEPLVLRFEGEIWNACYAPCIVVPAMHLFSFVLLVGRVCIMGLFGWI